MKYEALSRRGLSAACLLALVLASCSSTPADGTITGVASPCTGPLSPVPYSKLPVTVYLSEGAHTVAHQSVTGAHAYRFVVPPGEYVVATHEGNGSNPVSVTVRSGETTRANIPSYCM
jgi:hypothetical protein